MGQAKALAEKLWQAQESGDYELVRQLCAPDVEITMPGGVHLHGPDQLVPMLRSYHEAFPDSRHAVVDSVESGNTVALELRSTGTHTGPMRTPNGEIPPTGKQIVWESVDYIKIDGNKVKSWHTYFDQMAFMIQIGLMPAPANS